MNQSDKNIMSVLGIILVTGIFSLVTFGSQIFGDEAGIFSKKVNLGLDLQGGSQLTYRVDLSEALPTQRAAILDGVKSVIENRVNSLGVAEPNVYTSEAEGVSLLVVELPGIKDKGEALAKIGKVVELEFMEEKRTFTDGELAEIVAKNKVTMGKVTGVLAQIKADPSQFDELQKLHSEGGIEQKTGSESTLPPQIVDALTEIKTGQVNPDIFPVGNKRFIFRLDEVSEKEVKTANEGLKIVTENEDGEIAEVKVEDVTPTTEKVFKYSQISFSVLSEHPEGGWARTGLTGAQFEFADVDFDEFGRPTVSISFDDEGAEKFGEITGRNIQKPIAIFIDGYPADFSTNKKLNEQRATRCQYQLVEAEDGQSYCPYAPIVQAEIADGRAVITGQFTQEEAFNISRNLNTGAIPAPVTLIGQQNVGATLGEEALQTGVRAGLWGLLIVAVFMMAWYRLSGVLAVIALGIYAVTLVAVFKLVGVTLTLAGIAGVILSIGMAVDANILIFERMKEEFEKGKGFADALREGFVRAWTSIRDSNVSSLITASILFLFGSGAVRGFAVTLSIGILVSMVTAIFVTRNLLEAFSNSKLAEKKSLWVRLKKGE